MSSRSALFLALALAVGLSPYLVQLTGDIAPLDKDYGRISLPELLQVRAALLDGVLLEWNAAFLSGTPYAPVPNAGGFYPPLLLSLVVFGTPMGVGVMNVLHLAFGALGCVLLARRAGADPVVASFAAVAYLWGSMTRLLGWTLPMETIGTAWVPWSLLCVIWAIDARRWMSTLALGALAGAAHAGVAWSGAYISLMPALLAMGVIVMAISVLRRPLWSSLLRGVLALVALAVFSVGLMAGRILPIQAWTVVTDRAGPISMENALTGRFALGELPSAFAGEGWILFGLAAIGVAFAIFERRRMAIALGVGTLLVIVLSTGILTPFLHAYVPGFDRLRQPYRNWILMPALLSPLAAFGLCRLILRLPERPLLRYGAGLLIAGLAAAESLFVQSGIFDQEAAAPVHYSLSERLENNAVLHEVVRLREEEGPYRVHAYEATRVLLKHTHALHATFLGLETMEGILGNVVIVPYDVEFLNPSRDAPARMWGMLAGRWITSSVPRDDEGLTLIGKYADDPDEIYEGSDGPYLYRNELCLPRAFLVDDAILSVDPRRFLWGKVNAADFWSPFETVLIDAGPDPSPQLLAHFERGVVPDKSVEASPAVQAAKLALVPPSAFQDNRPKTPIRPIDPPQHDWNRITVDLPDDAGGSWLVLAETCSIYPGWTAEADGVEVPIYRANGAATTLFVPEGARRIELRYRTPDLRKGMAISAGMALLLAVLSIGAWRTRASKAPAA